MKDHHDFDDRREQRQQPRFNRREFLAAQQTQQELPPTTTREERSAHHPQPERQQRFQREDRPQRPPRDPDMTVAQYREELAKIKWLFAVPYAEQSFHGVVESMEQQIRLYNMGRRLTPTHLKAFVEAQQRAHQAAMQMAIAEAKQEANIHFLKLERTGDETLDSFRQACREFDWTWAYSDDGDVARASQAQEELLLAVVKEKGGLYEAYWNLCSAYFRG